MADLAWLVGVVLYLIIMVTLTFWFFRYHCDKRLTVKHREPEFTNQPVMTDSINTTRYENKNGHDPEEHPRI